MYKISAKVLPLFATDVCPGFEELFRVDFFGVEVFRVVVLREEERDWFDKAETTFQMIYFSIPE